MLLLFNVHYECKDFFNRRNAKQCCEIAGLKVLEFIDELVSESLRVRLLVALEVEDLNRLRVQYLIINNLWVTFKNI